jgi:hypothetical protein
MCAVDAKMVGSDARGRIVVGQLRTYHQVGVVAPVLLALMRFSQGLALVGEWSGAALLVTETAEPDRRARERRCGRSWAHHSVSCWRTGCS